MDDNIYLSTLLYKSIVDKSTNNRQLMYKVLGPMMGTIEDNIFINTHDRNYFSIQNNTTNMDDNIRYAYYNLISLKEAKKKYNTQNIKKVVEKYKEEYKNDSYFVIDKDNYDPIIIRYDENKFKRVYESNVAKAL